MGQKMSKGWTCESMEHKEQREICMLLFIYSLERDINYKTVLLLGPHVGFSLNFLKKASNP